MRRLILLCFLLLPLTGTSQPAAHSFTRPGADGEPVTFQVGQHPRPALLLFWATWCPYCARLMPELQKVRDQVPVAELDILAIHVFDEEGDPVAYLERHGYGFTLVRDGDAVAKAYGVKGTPGLFLLDTDGTVLYQRISGAKPQAVSRAILKVLGHAESPSG